MSLAVADAAAPDRSATGCGIAAIVLWSSLALLTTLTDGLPPFQLLATTFGIAGAGGLLLVVLRGDGGLRGLAMPWPAFALAVGGLAGYHALYFIALKHAPVAAANLLNYLWPLLVVVLAALAYGPRLRATQLAGCLLGLAAAVLLVTGGAGITIDAAHAGGYAAAVGASVTWAAYSVLNRRFAHVPSRSIVLACCGTAVVGALLHGALETTVAPSPSQWAVLLAMGAGPVGAAFWLWDRGTKRGNLALLGTLSYAAPLLSTGLLVLAGRAPAHWTQAVAIALLLAGAWLGSRAATREG